MSEPKVVVLTAVRNEEWIIGLFLRAMSHVADHIVIADQHSTDRTRSICREFDKVVLIDNDSPNFNEPERQALLINTARRLFPGPKLLLRLDADDIPSGNLFSDPEWRGLLHAPPGAPIELQNVCLYGSPNEYRTDRPDMYGVSFVAYGMIDSGRPYSADQPMHTPHLPFQPSATPHRLKNVVSMHYQFVDVERAVMKQRWYMCYERLRFPQKSALAIINGYRWVLWDVHKWPPLVSVREWSAGWEQRGVNLADVVVSKHHWWTWEILRLFDEFGEDRFEGLPIWDYDWEGARQVGLAQRVEGLPQRAVRDPRPPQVKIAHCMLEARAGDASQRIKTGSLTGDVECPAAVIAAAELSFVQSEGTVVVGEKLLIKRDYKISMLPLVTVITPAYNRASYLDETIQSVLGQDYPRIEYIVLDDGSKDNTREVLDKYTGRIIWETHPNMGETRTVNKGFSMTHGEIVVVVNSDDPLLPGAVSAAVVFMEAHPDILVAYPDWNYIGPNSEVTGHIQVQEYDFLYMVRHHFCTPGPGAFIRRKALELTGPRDPEFRYVADYEYWLRLGLYGKFARIPRTLATFRVHPDSASVSSHGALMAEEHIRLIKRLYTDSDLPTGAKKVRREAFAWAHVVAGVTCGRARGKAAMYYIKAVLYYPPVLGGVGLGLAWRVFRVLPAPLQRLASSVRHALDRFLRRRGK